MLVYRDVLKRLSIGYSDIHKHLREHFDENYSQLNNSTNNGSGVDLEDPTNKLISSALAEMKKVQSEYGNMIKIEDLSVGSNPNHSNDNDDEFV